MPNTDQINQPDEAVFDSVTREFLADIDKAMTDAVNAAVKPYIEQKRTVMQHFIRLERLNGEWEPKPDGSGMVRAGGAPLPIPAPQLVNPTKKSRSK